MISSICFIPSSVKSTDIPKKLKPLEAGLVPATRLFDQPRAFNADRMLPGPSCPIRWLT